MSLIFPYSFGGAGSSGDSSIQVFKTTDFEPVTAYSSSYSVKYVKFQGHNNGRILLIHPIDKFDPSSYNNTYHYNSNYLGNDYINMFHLGNNIYDPYWMYPTNNSYGITISKTANNGITVSGTATRDNDFIAISISTYGYAIDSYEPPLKSIKCFGITGTVNDLKIGFQNGTFVNINQEAQATNYNYIYLRVTSGTTYNCTFYPQIINTLGTQNHYEKPFRFTSYHRTGGCSLMSQYSSKPKYQADSSNSYYIKGGRLGNRSGRIIADYPIVHEGTNIFFNADSEQFNKDFAVYYTEDEKTISEFIQNERSLVKNDTDMGLYFEGSWKSDSSMSNWSGNVLVSIPKKVYDCMKGLWFLTGNNSNSVRISSFRELTHYCPKTDFVNYKEEITSYQTYSTFEVPQNSGSFTNSTTYYYVIKCDFDDFSDSTTIT